MKVTFHHPPTETANHFTGFEPGNIYHYPKGAGVYIYGFKRIIDRELVFIPLYVGIAQDLNSRLWQHYIEEKTGGNSKWYVFDYESLSTRRDVESLYRDMKIADSKKGISLLRYSDKMIWFNHFSFFDFRLSSTGCSNYISNTGVLASILPNGDLDRISATNPKVGAHKLKSSTIASKAVFDDNFYFIYSSLKKDVEIGNTHELFEDYQKYISSSKYMDGRKNGPGRKMAERIEQTTKQLLGEINIYTSAKPHGKFYNMEIDLSKIKSCLINIGRHVYNDKNGTYINPLIIK